MLAAIHIAQSLPCIIAVTLLELLVPLHKLLALEAVEQNATESLIEVLLDTRDGFLEDVCIC